MLPDIAVDYDALLESNPTRLNGTKKNPSECEPGPPCQSTREKSKHKADIKETLFNRLLNREYFSSGTEAKTLVTENPSRGCVSCFIKGK